MSFDLKKTAPTLLLYRLDATADLAEVTHHDLRRAVRREQLNPRDACARARQWARSWPLMLGRVGRQRSRRTRLRRQRRPHDARPRLAERAGRCAPQRSCEQLRARADWTEERLAYARDQLAEATSNAITADEQLATLQGASVDAEGDIAHRVRAIEQSGGAAALFAQALDADAITDVTSNVAALNGVLATDVVRASDADAARDQMADVRRRLDAIADERARAVGQGAGTRRAGPQRSSPTSEPSSRQPTYAWPNLVAAMERRAEKRRRRPAPSRGPDRFPKVQPPTPARPSPPHSAKLGSPYVWGDEGPSTFDCSGLIQWSYLQAGLVLPRVSSDQWSATTPVPVDDMQPGDLLVYAYDSTDAGTIHHIAMYIGNGQMIHAPRTGRRGSSRPRVHDGLYGVGRPGL